MVSELSFIMLKLDREYVYDSINQITCDLLLRAPSDVCVRTSSSKREHIVQEHLAPVQKALPPTDSGAHPQKIPVLKLTHSFMSVELLQEPRRRRSSAAGPAGLMKFLE